MGRRLAAAALVLVLAGSARAAPAEEGVIIAPGGPDLSVQEPAPAHVSLAPAQTTGTKPHNHSGLAAIGAGVAIGAALMLIGNFSDDPKKAQNFTRAGLGVMIVLPLTGALWE